jgi:hypothetical protein
LETFRHTSDSLTDHGYAIVCYGPASRPVI